MNKCETMGKQGMLKKYKNVQEKYAIQLRILKIA